jgi:hypothetical protein
MRRPVLPPSERGFLNRSILEEDAWQNTVHFDLTNVLMNEPPRPNQVLTQVLLVGEGRFKKFLSRKRDRFR